MQYATQRERDAWRQLHAYAQLGLPDTEIEVWLSMYMDVETAAQMHAAGVSAHHYRWWWRAPYWVRLDRDGNRQFGEQSSTLSKDDILAAVASGLAGPNELERVLERRGYRLDAGTERDNRVWSMVQLDLHGWSVAEVHAVLPTVLREMRRTPLRSLQLVTGRPDKDGRPRPVRAAAASVLEDLHFSTLFVDLDTPALEVLLRPREDTATSTMGLRDLSCVNDLLANAGFPARTGPPWKTDDYPDDVCTVTVDEVWGRLRSHMGEPFGRQRFTYTIDEWNLLLMGAGYRDLSANPALAQSKRDLDKYRRLSRHDLAEGLCASAGRSSPLAADLYEPRLKEVWNRDALCSLLADPRILTDAERAARPPARHSRR